MTLKISELSAKCGLKIHVIEKILSVLKQHLEIESAVFYGSRAKGNFRLGSDIDLTLTGENLTYRILTNIETDIDDLLLPYLFDLSILRQIENPNVVEHIHRFGLSFYEREADDIEAAQPHIAS
ncbi:MAG: nucleotidyltransferase domain-containing protein [Phormidesmis sp.]